MFIIFYVIYTIQCCLRYTTIAERWTPILYITCEMSRLNLSCFTKILGIVKVHLGKKIPAKVFENQDDLVNEDTSSFTVMISIVFSS